MKKLKNKFILVVISIIALIVFSQVYVAYSNSNVDTNSYLMLVKGNATLNESHVEPSTKYILSSGDKVRVIGDSSLAVIEWGDGSLTRLGGNTKISIDQNQISRDFTDINISFELIAGKTWSNIVSFIGHDSSFTQTFAGMEAGVRGTVFDVDLTNDFIHVSDHQVTLTTPDGEIVITEGNVLELSDFSFVDITNFITSMEDATWKKLNEEFDQQYFTELKKELSLSLESKNPFLFILEWVSPKYRILYALDTSEKYEDVEKLITKLSESKKQKVYDAVLSKYQKMNFVGSSDYEFYKKKVFYRKALISLANDGDKQALIRSTSYDAADMVQSGEMQLFSDTIGALLEHKDILKDIDTSLLKDQLNYIPEDLRIEFGSSLKELEGMLQFETLQNFDLRDAEEKIGEGLDVLDKKVQNLLEENVGGLLDSLSQ